MNYQDFESAWYLGLIITSFFAVMLTGLVMAGRRVRRLFAAGDVTSGWLTIGAGLYTGAFLFGLCIAMLVLLVARGSG